MIKTLAIIGAVLLTIITLQLVLRAVTIVRQNRKPLKIEDLDGNNFNRAIIESLYKEAKLSAVAMDSNIRFNNIAPIEDTKFRFAKGHGYVYLNICDRTMLCVFEIREQGLIFIHKTSNYVKGE